MIMELLEIYILNLLITVAMFLVLIFRAWIEYKNFRVMWDEIERRRNHETIKQMLKDNKEFFRKIDGGEKLYSLLCQVFRVED